MSVSADSTATPAQSERLKLPFAWIFAVWTLWGVWSVEQSVLAALASGQPAPPRVNPWQLSLATAWFWALLTPVLMWSTRLIRDRFRDTAPRLAAHLCVFAAVHVLDATTYWIGSDVIAANPRPFLPLLVTLVTFNGLTYTVIAVLMTALDAQHALRLRTARQGQLETQLALAQFHALRAQLHPHFLFNALNAISALIHSDPVRADRMLVQVSELLRIAIDTASSAEVPLHAEMEFARRYLEVERMRYGDRLTVHIDLAADARDALVPNMLLQPLVENAVRHGVAPHARAGRVDIVATRTRNGVLMAVRDTGAGFDDAGGNTGVGLSATRERLAKLYGAAQHLTFAIVPGGFEARVSLPLRMQEQPAS